MNLKEHFPHAIQFIEGIWPNNKAKQDELDTLNLVINIDNHLKLKKIMTTIDDALAEIGQLKTQVARNNEILAKLAEQAKAAGTDSEKLQALSDSILSITKDLTDADNTAAPAPAAEVTA